VARFRHGRAPDLTELARKAARWVKDNLLRIANADPKIPEAIYNRQADNWGPLLAIAEVIGGDIPKLTRRAALAACGVVEDPSHQEMLLADIREVFKDRDELSSADLVADLVAMADRPWPECNHGKALTQNLLARWLKPYGIRSKDVGSKHARVKGYARESFEDVFNRYLPGLATAHPRTGNENNNLDEKQTAHQKNECAVGDSPNPLETNKVRGVRGSEGGIGESANMRGYDDDLPPKPPAWETRNKGQDARDGRDANIPSLSADDDDLDGGDGMFATAALTHSTDRQCPACGEVKPITAFRLPGPHHLRGREECKECIARREKTLRWASRFGSKV
jgi:hypothetical protein